MSAAIDLKEGHWPRRFLWFRALPAVNHSSCVTSADRVVSRIGVRDLPIHRIREHLQVANNWAPVLNALLSSAALSEDEITVLISIILLRPKQYPNNAKLRQITGIRYRSLLKALDSLVARRILFFDVWHYGKLPEEKKNIWHISSPCFWKIEGWPSSSFNSSGKTDPESWIPRRLYTAPDVRIDEYTDEAVASEEYVKAPRSLGDVELKLSNSAKRIWLYLASLPSISHPTSEQLARAVRVTKPTALRGLRMLSQAGMIVRHDYRHSRMCPSPESTYHIVHPSYWDSPASSWYDEPEVSIAHTPELISYIALGKNGKYTGSNRETHTVKTGNALGKNGKRTGTNREIHSVKTGNALGKIGKYTEANREIGGGREPLSEGGFPNFSVPCEKDPGEKDPSEKLSHDEEEDLLNGLPIYKEPGRPSYLVTKLVKNFVEYPFQDKKTGHVFPVPLNDWIADFMMRSKRDLGTLKAGYEETVQFCKFVREHFGHYTYHPRDQVFEMMEKAWAKHKAAAAEAAAKSTELQSSDTAAESQNPALECEKKAHHSYSIETAFQPPVLEILPSLPVEAEPEHQAAISSVEPLPEAGVPTEQKKPEDQLPTDPDRQQWLVARVYAKARKSQREALDTLWKKAPGRMLPMLRFFSALEYSNLALVDSARAELDALGILRKADIPALPWLDSGELAPVVTPAAAPKEVAGDGTLPLNRDRLKRALRRLLEKKEPNIRLRFEIDARFMAITDDAVFHAELCNKFGREAVEGVLDGNH